MNETPGDSPARRRRRSGETRGRLIEAALELVRQEGLSALSAGRVAKLAEISQPGFYKHFKNTDDLLQVAVTDLLSELAERQALGRLNLTIRSAEDLPPTAVWQQLTGMLLRTLLSEPRFAELYLRHRSDHTLLGGAFVQVAEQGLRDVVEFVWQAAQSMGAVPGDYERIVIGCDQALALYYRAAEMLLSGRYDEQRVIEQTAMQLERLTRSYVETLGK